jgi:hypothetical protein
VVLISDLEAVHDDTQACLDAIGLLARRHHRLLVIAPTGADFLPTMKTDAGDRVVQVLIEEERRRLEHARRELARRGVAVLTAAPGDSAEALVRVFYGRAHCGRNAPNHRQDAKERQGRQVRGTLRNPLKTERLGVPECGPLAMPWRSWRLGG